MTGASGRSQPRQAPLPGGFQHRVTFHGSVDGGLSARCRPCSWAVWIDGGHDLADLAELVRQHSGGTTAADQASTSGERTAGVSQAAWARHWFPANAVAGDPSTGIGRPAWLGDACGCTDDRCIGYHHDGGDDCGCLPVLLGQYLAAHASSSIQHSATGICTLAPDRPHADVGICRACLEQGLFDALLSAADCQARDADGGGPR